jgi:hypothetical protein
MPRKGLLKTDVLEFVRTRTPIAKLGSGLTATVADALTAPPAPVHVMEYVVVAVGETTLVPTVPAGVKLTPVQEVAFVEFHVSVLVAPM